MTHFTKTLLTLSTLAIIGVMVLAGSLTPIATPQPTSYTLNDIYNLVVNNATTTGGSATHTLSTTTTPTASTEPTGVVQNNEAISILVESFGKIGTLKLGMDNDIVMQIQTLLASDPSIYPEGLKTGYYGKLTVSAVKRFQKKYGISQVGYIGPSTFAKMMEIYGVNNTNSSSVIGNPVLVVYTKTLKFGSENDEVKNLQIYLALDPSLYPEARITGYYGKLTETAVIKFQKKYGIDPIGIVGPITRAKLNELNK